MLRRQPNDRAPVTGEDAPRVVPGRPGFRKRINPYYGGMTPRQIALDTAKTTAKWAAATVFFYAYWLAMLLLASLFLLNVWHVTIVRIFIYAGILCAVSSAVYAGVLWHRKFYY